MTFVRKEIVAFAVLGVLSVMSAVMMTGGLFTGGWSVTDGLLGPVMLVAVLAGLIGPFVAVWGIYVLRRATAEGRSPKRGRTMIVAGTCGIAAIGIAMFWLVLTPIIGVAIVVFWVRRVRVWKREPAVA